MSVLTESVAGQCGQPIRNSCTEGISMTQERWPNCVRILVCLGILAVAPAIVQGDNLLANPGFETVYNTVGNFPNDFGYWRGDLTAFTGPAQGITPYEGQRMMHLIASSAKGPTIAFIGSELVQLVDPTASGVDLSAGNAVAVVTAYYNRVPGDSETDTQFRVDVRTFAGDPYTYNSQVNNSELSMVQKDLFSDGDVATWQACTAVVPVPPETGFVAVRVAAMEDVVNDATYPEFDGHYVDATSMVIVPMEDCNSNGMPDVLDIAGGTSKDCDRSGVPDECELASPECPYLLGDVSNDGLVDEVDILQFYSVLLHLNQCGCAVAAADINRDGVVNVRDIRPFIRIVRCNLGLPQGGFGPYPAGDLGQLAQELDVELDLGLQLQAAAPIQQVQRERP